MVSATDAGYPTGVATAADTQIAAGSYFPLFLEPRKTSEKALVAVIQDAWIGAVSIRWVDDLVQAMGLSSISKSTVVVERGPFHKMPSSSRRMK